MIKFGRYDQKVSFVSFGQVPDGYGGFTPEESNVLTTFASVSQYRGTNDVESAQLELPKTFYFRIQQRIGFRPNQAYQIRYDGYLHVIKGIEQYKERLKREHIITAIRIEEAETASPTFEINTLDATLEATI